MTSAPEPRVAFAATAPLRVLVVVGASLVVGALTRPGELVLPDAVHSAANSTAPWALATFALVALAGLGIRSSLLLGAASFVAMDLSFYAAFLVGGGYYPHSFLVFWLVVALIAGPLAGLAATWLRRTGARRAIAIGALLAVCAAVAAAACPPAGLTRDELQAMKAQGWSAPTDDAARATLALGLLDCLSDPDPRLRDGLGFEALQHWMRGKRLAPATLQAMRARLLAVLASPPDAEGVAQPFAALALAEVARVDRLAPFLADDERAGLVDAGTRWLAAVRDYRGFDPARGWRHGVAHGADLMLQLALNPQLQRAQGEADRAALAAQVMADGDHAYRFGEPERLMAPVFYLARRDWWPAADWQSWFEALAARRAKPAEPDAVSLAQRHNLGAFIAALYVSVQESPDAALRERLLPGLRRAIASLD